LYVTLNILQHLVQMLPTGIIYRLSGPDVLPAGHTSLAAGQVGVARCRSHAASPGRGSSQPGEAGGRSSSFRPRTWRRFTPLRKLASRSTKRTDHHGGYKYYGLSSSFRPLSLCKMNRQP